MSKVRTYVTPTTRAQREALWKLWERTYPAIAEHVGLRSVVGRYCYMSFRKRFRPCPGGYIGGVWKGTFIGIEPDGHTHS